MGFCSESDSKPNKRNLRMYNMGFGDCFVIYDDNENLMVDFGSIHSEKALLKRHPNIFTHIDEYFYNNNSIHSLLITHFHEDHYKFVSKLRDDSLDKIYMRNIYSSSSQIKLNILALIYFSKTSKIWKTAYDILTATSLVGKGKFNCEYHFVKEKDYFSVGATKYQVLAPFDGIKENDNDEEIEEINKLFSKLINQFPDADKLFNLILNVNQIFIRKEENVFALTEEEVNQIKAIYLKILILIKLLESQKKKLLKAKKSAHFVIDKKSLSKLIISNDEHKYNIVFKNEENTLLMCGDEKSKDMKKIIKNINSKIDIIKTPHHGTKSHYTKAIEAIRGTKYIATNNYTGRYTGIYNDYFKIGTHLYCSEGGVVKCDNYSLCKCLGPNCNKIGEYHDFNF